MWIVIIIIIIVIFAIVRINSELKPKDPFMISIFKETDFPDCNVYKSADTGKYYISPYMLHTGDRKVFSGTKYECESWVKRNK